MGIHHLSKILTTLPEGTIKIHEMKNYHNKAVAIDAHVSLYQFLISVRPNDGTHNGLTNRFGETTSHLQGMFHRTVRMMHNGIKPCFVFDGKAPDLKRAELTKRRDKYKEALKDKKQAMETGDFKEQEKFVKRTVKVTSKIISESKELLKLMGVPVIEAPSESEAQCAAMTRHGLVHATGSEDYDALPFGSPVVLRNLTFSDAKKLPIKELHLDTILKQLKVTSDQFIDLCILLGCDYCGSIRGIGPVRALELVLKHGSLEKVLDSLDKKKYPLPSNFEFHKVQKLFKQPDIIDPKKITLNWTKPDEEGIVKFLVKGHDFSEERVRNAVVRMMEVKDAPGTPKRKKTTIKRDEYDQDDFM